MEENYTFETRHVNAIAWNSSGTKVAITTSDWGDSDDIYLNHHLKIIDAVSGRVEIDISAGCDFIVDTLTWRKEDTEIVLISGGGEFRCFDVQAGCQLVNQWETRGLVQADFNPSRTQVALAARRHRWDQKKHPKEPEVLEIYSTDTGKMLQSELLSSDYHEWIGWSPDGSRIAIGNRKSIIKLYRWNGSTFAFEREFIFADQTYGRHYGAWSPDSRQLALIGKNGTLADIAIHDIEQKWPILYLDQSTVAYSLAWSVDGNLIASWWNYLKPDAVVRIWDTHSGKIIEDIERNHSSKLAWSPNGVLALGHIITYEEWIEDPTITGVSIYRPKFLSPP